MNRKRIERAYDKLVREIEELRMYDGRGTIDRYTCCECGNIIHTTYKDKGVTPFTIRCRKCGGIMGHTDTFNEPMKDVKVLNWYRPTLKATLKMSDGMIEHILNGGLILENK